MNDVQFTVVTPISGVFVRMVDVRVKYKYVRILERYDGSIVINSFGIEPVIYDFKGGFLAAQLYALELLGVEV